MQDKYENLLERTTKSIEQNASVTNSMLEVSKSINDNLKDLNEKFVLHCSNATAIKQDTDLIKTELLKWLKWSIFALIIAIGGKSIIEIAATFLTK